MKVALFASAFYPHIGGVEETVRQLAHEYRRTGIDVVVLTNRWPRSLPLREEYEGISVVRLPMRVPDGGLKAKLTYGLTHRAIRKKVFRVVQEFGVDVLHVQCVSATALYALWAKRCLNIPLVVTTQGERTMDAAELYQRSVFMNRVLRDALSTADAITACSRDTLEDIERYHGKVLGRRASVIYNGIRREDYDGTEAYSHPRPYICGMGRLVSQKGFDILIRAFVEARLPSHDLIIAGEGPARDELEALTGQLGAAARVRFLGRADRSTAVALLKGCEFFVLPSRKEPLGIVNLEAMAAGKPVIAADVGGVPEIVQDRVTGILVRPDNVFALTSAIRQLSEDGAERSRMGTNGRLRAESFTWKAIADQYTTLYRTLTWTQSTN